MQQHSKVALASWIGTTVEFFDFYIYATAASLVLNKIFFPDLSPIIGVAAALATYGVAYIARPAGGIIFGRLGDRLGRRRVLIITILLMGACTVGVGVLPGYSVLGPAAAVILVVLRLTQGVAVGGEWGGAVLMGLEHSPANKKTLYASFAQMGSPTGLLLANISFLALGGMSNELFTAIGWRIPFLASAVLILVGLAIRTAVDETPEFTNLDKAGRVSKSPLRLLFQTEKRSILLGILLVMAPSGPFYLVNTFLVSYLTTEGDVPRNQVLMLPFLVGLTQAVFCIPIALLSDRIGARKVAIIGCAGAGLVGYPLFAVAAGGSMMLTSVMAVIGALSATFIHAAFGSLVPMQFPPDRRYSGAAISYNVSLAVGGGILPVLTTLSVSWFNGSILGASIVTAILAIGGLIGASLMKNNVNAPREAGRVSANTATSAG